MTTPWLKHQCVLLAQLTVPVTLRHSIFAPRAGVPEHEITGTVWEATLSSRPVPHLRLDDVRGCLSYHRTWAVLYVLRVPVLGDRLRRRMEESGMDYLIGRQVDTSTCETYPTQNTTTFLFLHDHDEL